MKTLNTLFILVIVILSSCKDNSIQSDSGAISSITITLTGSSNVNKSYTMIVLSSEASCDTINKVTTGKFVGVRSSVLKEVSFNLENYRPGIYYWSGASKVFISLDSSNTDNQIGLLYSTNDGETRIPFVGEVGETINGEFTGKFVSYKWNKRDTLLVSGVFKIKRNK